MKWRNVLVALAFAMLVVFFIVGITDAAEPPEPFLFGMVDCAGFDVGDLKVLRLRFDNWYGVQHNAVDWSGSYHARMNEFAASLGCPRVFTDEGQLTLKYRIVAEWQANVYQWFIAE